MSVVQSRGGKARAQALSPERRSETASQAAKKRWGKTSEATVIIAPTTKLLQIRMIGRWTPDAVGVPLSRDRLAMIDRALGVLIAADPSKELLKLRADIHDYLLHFPD